LKDPLAQFQTTKAEREDTRKLIHTINRALGELALPDNKVNEAFDVWWPRLEQRLGQIVLGISISKPKRTDRDVLEEILELAREQARHRHGTRARNEGFRGGKVFAEPKRDPETTKPIRQTHRDLHHSPQITWGLTGIYPKVYANVIERGNDEFVAETNEGIRYRVRINNRSGKGSRTKTQPGITVKLYHRPGEEFFRYRFLGG
jgi:hypothetical protein